MGEKQDSVNPKNRIFGEIILSGFVYDVYKDGKYVASFIASLYPIYPTLSPLVSLDRKIENIQNIVKDVFNDYLKSDEFKTSVLNIIREDFRFLQTNESKTDPEDDPDEKISLGKQLQNYIDERIDRKIEERMKKYDESFKRIEENLSKLLTREDKQPKVESELNDVVKQLDELKKKLDEISKQLPLVKESTSQAVQTVGEKVYTSTPLAVQTPEKIIEPAPQAKSAMQSSTPIIEEVKNYAKEKERKIKTRASTILEAYKLNDEEIQNLIDNYIREGKSEEEILPLEIALAIKTRRIYSTIWKGNFEYRGDSRLLNAVKEIFDQKVDGANEIYKLMYWPEEEVKRDIERKKKEMEEAYERDVARRTGIF
jgi:ferritin